MKKPARRTRAAIYTRVSTADQDTANQTRQLIEYCNRAGYRIIEQYADYSSGNQEHRQGFDAMMQAARQRKFDVLVFWSMDRLTRRGTLRTLEILNQLTSYGCQFQSFTEQYLDSCGLFKDALIGILGALAKQERSRISERTKAGMDRARAIGHLPGRPRRILNIQKAAEQQDKGWRLKPLAKEHGVSPATLSRRLREWRKQREAEQTDGAITTSTARQKRRRQ